MALTLIYVVRMVQSTLFAEARNAHPLQDVTPREVLVLTPLVIGILYLGLHPAGVLDLLQGPVTDMLNQFSNAAVASAM